MKPRSRMTPRPPRIVYSPEYNFHFWGLEKLHPFDTHKFERAWQILVDYRDTDVYSRLVRPHKPVSDEDILRVHSPEYLKLLDSARYVAQALEVPLVGLIPNRLLRTHVLQPMRFATQGTILAATEALSCGSAINLSGGYHHASRECGEGFCIFADISIAIACLRYQGHLSVTDKIGVIDLDAHQANGLERLSQDDASISILDMYNADIYPRDEWAKRRIDFSIPVRTGTDDETYLGELRSKLPKFFEVYGPFSLVIYNAGTDIYFEDPLGQLAVSRQGILKRDRFVLSELARRGIPWTMLPGGGYTKASAALLAESVYFALSELF